MLKSKNRYEKSPLPASKKGFFHVQMWLSGLLPAILAHVCFDLGPYVEVLPKYYGITSTDG